MKNDENELVYLHAMLLGNITLFLESSIKPTQQNPVVSKYEGLDAVVQY